MDIAAIQVTDAEVRDWHRTNGGHATRPAGHALRILREVVELCVASGASRSEIYEAVAAEDDKATGRQEFGQGYIPYKALEEFIDVTLLMKVFRGYFIDEVDLLHKTRAKMEVVRNRAWEPDADGVLWRPGTRGAGTVPGSAESS